MSTSTQGSNQDSNEALAPVRWGVLGASNFAQKVSLPGMRRGPLTALAALASRDLDKASAAARALGIPKAYGSYEELLADPDIEAIYNPLPNHLHVEWTARAMRAGKHVLCEKPIALDAKDAATLLGVQRETGKLIAEAFMVRYHPQWRQAKAWVESGRIGELVSVQTAFSYFNRDAANIRNRKEVGGGALYDIGCYAVNTSRYLFGREPERAIALIERDPEFGTDRLTSGLVDYGGAHLTFTCSTQAVPYQRVNAFGTRGRIEIEIPFNAPADKPCRAFLDDGSILGGGSAEMTGFPVVNQYHLQSEAFSRAIRTGEPIENSIEIAVGNMRVIDALFRSAESGGWEKI
jgi:predicted dehydrogenase